MQHGVCVCFFFFGISRALFSFGDFLPLGDNFLKKNPMQVIQNIFVKIYAKVTQCQGFNIYLFPFKLPNSENRF
jgi:hypothetical protein